MFSPFSAQHGITILIGAVIIAVLIIMGKRGGRSKTIATGILAFFCLSAYPLSLAAWRATEGNVALGNALPFHLCDIAAFTAGFALLTRRPLLCTLTYFWGLAATMQGLITPAINYGFPHWPFITFFIHHFVIVGAALYLPIVEGWRPKTPFWRSPVEVFGYSILYLILSLGLNLALKTNFGFSMHAPHNPSLIDKLGPWPWYLFSMQGIALTLFLLLALPFIKSEKMARQNES